jgi:putative methionine-R-sulfoxide reductase with GAF domain
VASDLTDEEALGGVTQLLWEERPSWDWVGIYLLVGGTLWWGLKPESTRNTGASG